MSSLKKYWKSLQHKKRIKKSKENFNEFPQSKSGPSVLEDANLSRRSFLKTMGASLVLAGATSCTAIRKPQEKIYPYVNSPENLVPGKETYYATSFALREEITGLLVKSLEGRPIKIEGNPLFPENQGSTNSFQQASILNLYNPDRVAQVVYKQEKNNPSIVKKWLKNALTNEGGKTGILFNEVNSLTSLNLLNEIKVKFPQLKLYEYSPNSNRNVYQGIKDITSEEAFPLINFKKTKVIVSLDCDFLGLETNSLRYNREFMGKRKEVNVENFNRLYQYENSFSITGGVADHRFAIKRSNIELIAYAILNELYQKSISRINRTLVFELEKRLINSAGSLNKLLAFKNIAKVVSDLFSYRGQAVVLAGAHLSPFTHSVIYYINQILNAPITYYAPSLLKQKLFGSVGENSLAKIVADKRTGDLEKLIVIGGDPVYNSYSDLNFKATYSSLNTCFLTEHNNLTASLSQLVVPQKNYLEYWSDNYTNTGNLAVVQPLITSLFKDSLSEIDLLNLVLNKKNKAVKDVQATVKNLGLKWKDFVHNGFSQVKSLNYKASLDLIDINRFTRKVLSQNKLIEANKKTEIALNLDYSVYDGRYINNAWLQELPDPISKLTWDNAVFISHRDAKKLSLKNYDLVELEVNRKKITGAIWILPGQAEGSITLKLGYGQKEVGKVGVNSGFNAYNLFFKDSTLYAYDSSGVSVKKLDKKYILASVQDHWTIEDQFFSGKPSSNSQNGRPLVREGSLPEYLSNPRFARDQVKVPKLKEEHERVKNNPNPKEPMFSENMSVFSEKKYDQGYQWGMTIDLSTCTGCNACVVACQSENNIPVVGKELVLQGREMHWIRLDRYFEGDVDSPRMVHQPVNCMQCEQAPCEQVCPVVATVHSDEGLNDMVYNRCIGTRFCSNNCPFKVRRFNFFDYHQRSPHAQKKVSTHLFELFNEPQEFLQLQFNPDVTVRMRGVMEKCTYCVQRINSARVKSKNQGRTIQDGEIKTACEQVCPTASITFGDINNPLSQVSQLKKKDRNYHLLAELNIKPRTTYLASINNPNPNVN